MSCKRCEEIQRFLQFTDNMAIPTDNADKFVKIRPVLDDLHNKFHEAIVPREFQSVDKMVIPFRGKSHQKQYIKNEPKKLAFKVWARADEYGCVLF